MRAALKFFRLIFSASVLIPLILISLYAAVFVFLRGALPTSQELLEHLTALYARFGYEVVFLGAFLEALILINLFVPGALAAGLGAVFARVGELDLTLVVVVATMGATLGYSLDFLLGYFGFAEVFKRFGLVRILTQARSQIEKAKVKTFAIGFIHTSTGSLLSVAAGTLKMNFFSFLPLALLSTLAWVSFWGLLIFAIGEVFLIMLAKYAWVLVLLTVSVWILTVIYGNSKK